LERVPTNAFDTRDVEVLQHLGQSAQGGVCLLGRGDVQDETG
jgi:hypothetical protein